VLRPCTESEGNRDASPPVCRGLCPISYPLFLFREPVFFKPKGPPTREAPLLTKSQPVPSVPSPFPRIIGSYELTRPLWEMGQPNQLVHSLGCPPPGIGRNNAVCDLVRNHSTHPCKTTPRDPDPGPVPPGSRPGVPAHAASLLRSRRLRPEAGRWLWCLCWLCTNITPTPTLFKYPLPRFKIIIKLLILIKIKNSYFVGDMYFWSSRMQGYVSHVL